MASQPQECPKCKHSLADPAVPDGYDPTLFSLVETGQATRAGTDQIIDVWRCPYCGHLWERRAMGREVTVAHTTPNRAMRRKAARRR
jgi:predicted RNA-binding Zn-ribbon protein involved in translation (DUF1610 family)